MKPALLLIDFVNFLDFEGAARGGAARTLAERLAPQADDIPVLKPRHSGFYGTPLDFLLEELQVQTLIVTGLAADNCVFATAQDGYVRKFRIWVPRDCIAAESAQVERSVLAHMRRTLKADTRPAGRGPAPLRA